MCVFLALVVIVAGIGVLAWFGWQRVANHLHKSPAAKKYFAEHIVTPLLLGEQEPDSDEQAPGEPDRHMADR